MSPCPIGVPGELYVGGGQLGRGYLARPALTAERFVPDPFSARAGSAAVPDGRPGAVARGREPGVPGPPGRAGEDPRLPHRAGRDRGARCARRQASRDCTVVVREDETGDRRLVAYVVGDAEAEALREHLRQEPAGVHGAGGVRGAGRAAADRRTASWTARRCRRRRGMRTRGGATRHRWARWRRRWRRSGRRCWAWSGWGGGTTSSSWAGTRCWRSS